MIRVKEGDLLQAEETIIAHQVNCFGVTGGLAEKIFEKWPEVKADYLGLTAWVGRRDRKALLGLVRLSTVNGQAKLVANLYGQYYPGADYRPDALRSALKELADTIKCQDYIKCLPEAAKWKPSVAMPYDISCGICGGDWDEVRQIIEETMQGVDVTLYKLE